jgi:hypothetical protein
LGVAHQYLERLPNRTTAASVTKFLTYFACAILLLNVTGCVTAPTPATAFREISATSGRSLLYVALPQEDYKGMVGLGIMLNKKRIATLSRGEYTVLSVEPGTYAIELEVPYGFGGRQEVERFTVIPDKKYYGWFYSYEGNHRMGVAGGLPRMNTTLFHSIPVRELEINSPPPKVFLSTAFVKPFP